MPGQVPSDGARMCVCVCVCARSFAGSVASYFVCVGGVGGGRGGGEGSGMCVTHKIHT